MSCEVTVLVTLGPEGEGALEIPSTCDVGISWTKMSLPDWELRNTYAPPSAYVPGNVLLAAVPDSGAIPMTVSVEGTSLDDLEDKKVELETALAAWPGLFKAVATDDTGTVTIAGPWKTFPTIPRWGDVLPTVLGHYLLEATFSLPVNPTGAP